MSILERSARVSPTNNLILQYTSSEALDSNMNCNIVESLRVGRVGEAGERGAVSPFAVSSLNVLSVRPRVLNFKLCRGRAALL